ncbi:MAG: hypothetical protein A2W90_12060 [Bacteroidetes bacterium GWF2_42_66]|nr:MAG: hypothetical protein A2W92_23365 [Bacteroidetes bacterium GWA2_42_15]OFX99926.1 MAG: hypothetical protein A2W89_17045 [Bacteroidetes bacterium GWE2_42_39]OFY40111.1 MAG: hypothetical protein A2W90_12060 [Bacteroidetes bacterium GWF2_42_66]HBL73934.1 hypothetical protein [Prolixibacteraceae bacterium]HCR89256.1 hypothetical protein [Prolixibacteraceae bacterium]
MTLYKQLSGFVDKGAGLLDCESINAVEQFICSLQNADGGFSDRAGHSDLYYSLFAHFILNGIHQTDYQEQLKSFVSERGKEKGNQLVDLCCLAILNKDLKGNRLWGLKFLFSALKYSTIKGYGGSQVYPYFLLLLTLDVYGFNNRLTRCFAHRFYRNDAALQGLPCPALAAQIVFKKQLERDVRDDCNLLVSYFDEKFGFKVFPEAGSADLLSTSVALFALKTSNFDITLLAPGCLQFVDNNFREGAFLSGDGDENRDSEYTFYGLLALGALA